METINIKGMSCQHCVASVTEALEGLGMEEITVNLESGTASFKSSDSVSKEVITEAIENIGFEVE